MQGEHLVGVVCTAPEAERIGQQHGVESEVAGLVLCLEHSVLDGDGLLSEAH